MSTESHAEPVVLPRVGDSLIGSRAVRLFMDYGVLLILVGLFAGITIAEPSFGNRAALFNLLQQWAPVGIMAMAGTFVLIAGGFDFSVAGVMAFAVTLSAGFSHTMGTPLAFLVVMAMCTVIGSLNGLLITKTRVNAFIATLAMGLVFRGVAQEYSGGKPLVDVGSGYDVLGGKIGDEFPYAGIFLIVALAAGGIVLARSVYGRSVYAIGGNPQAARLSGISVNKVLIATYALSGLSAGVAGILFGSRLGLGQADVAGGFEIDVVTAIVIGGTAIGGGSGAMWRTAVGVGVLAVLDNGLDAVQVQPNKQTIIKGLVLIAAVAWDVFVRRRRAALNLAESHAAALASQAAAQPTSTTRRG
jgi:ribose transport system permease protein